MKALLYVFVSLFIVCMAGTPPYSSSLAELAEYERDGRDLDETLRVVKGLSVGRVTISNSVAAGRITMLEAAALFRDLDRRIPAHLLGGYPVYPGKSEGERLCRKVIDYLEIAFPRGYYVDNREECRARLTEELEELLALSDTILLPEITSSLLSRVDQLETVTGKWRY